MNKKVIASLATTAALGAMMVATTDAHADEMTTNGSISFFEDSKPGTGPFEGNLKLAYVPEAFDFGNNDIKGVSGSKTYTQVIDKTKKQYVAVSDDRSTKTKGWTLNAKVDDFVSTVKDEQGKETTTTLTSAELAFNVGENQKYNIDVKASDANTPAVPTPAITTEGALTALPTTDAAYYTNSPATNAKIKLVAAGAEAKILNYTSPSQAPAEGTLGVAREVSGVTLNVKDHSNVKDKKFTSTVHWVLSEDPTV